MFSTGPKKIFSTIDQFDGGTFKFEKNIHFTNDMKQFEQQAADTFYSKHYPNQNKSYMGQMEAKPFVESQKALKMPGKHHTKTYIPIFP